MGYGSAGVKTLRLEKTSVLTKKGSVDKRISLTNKYWISSHFWSALSNQEAENRSWPVINFDTEHNADSVHFSIR
jgi:hypothetical protein